MINQFKGQYHFLSNFYPAPFKCTYKLIQRPDDITFATSEHFFQASKAATLEQFMWVTNSPTPGESKKRGRKVQLVGMWDTYKVAVMEHAIYAKFNQNPHVRQQLVNTGTQPLIEGNYWKDTFWGVCLRTNVGHNHLGNILMRLRAYYLTNPQDANIIY